MRKEEFVRIETGSLRENCVEISERDALGDCRDALGRRGALGWPPQCKKYIGTTHQGGAARWVGCAMNMAES